MGWSNCITEVIEVASLYQFFGNLCASHENRRLDLTALFFWDNFKLGYKILRFG